MTEKELNESPNVPDYIKHVVEIMTEKGTVYSFEFNVSPSLCFLKIVTEGHRINMPIHRFPILPYDTDIYIFSSTVQINMCFEHEKIDSWKPKK